MDREREAETVNVAQMKVGRSSNVIICENEKIVRYRERHPDALSKGRRRQQLNLQILDTLERVYLEPTKSSLVLSLLSLIK